MVINGEGAFRCSLKFSCNVLQIYHCILHCTTPWHTCICISLHFSVWWCLYPWGPSEGSWWFCFLWSLPVSHGCYKCFDTVNQPFSVRYYHILFCWFFQGQQWLSLLQSHKFGCLHVCVWVCKLYYTFVRLFCLCYRQMLRLIFVCLSVYLSFCLSVSVRFTCLYIENCLSVSRLIDWWHYHKVITLVFI